MYRLSAGNLQVRLSDIGARIVSIDYLIDGTFVPMTLGHTDPVAIGADRFYMGATCGPVCNRISNARYSIDGEQYRLPSAGLTHCLHGGEHGLDAQRWQIESADSQQVTMVLAVDNLADGFNGNRQFKVCYQIIDDGLHVTFNATTDQTSPINLTNHAYFNLGEATIFDLQMQLYCDQFLARDEQGIPTGEYIDSAQMGFDLSNWCSVNELVNHNQYSQMKIEQGIDHCFIAPKGKGLTPLASLRSASTGIALHVQGDQPAMQVYTGKFLEAPFSPYQGICFESQGLTDAVNQPDFTPIWVTPDQPYHHQLVYQFELSSLKNR